MVRERSRGNCRGTEDNGLGLACFGSASLAFHFETQRSPLRHAGSEILTVSVNLITRSRQDELAPKRCRVGEWPGRERAAPSVRRVRSTRLGSFPFARLAAAVCMLVSLAAPVSAAPSRLRRIHAEDFSTAKDYDSVFWIAETGFFRNREAQYYRPANVSIQGGALVLEGCRETALNAAYDPSGADWLTTTRSAEYTSRQHRQPRRFHFRGL